ncbi:hypothetical protein ABIC76_005034 [Ralstonia sp. 1138]
MPTFIACLSSFGPEPSPQALRYMASLYEIEAEMR